MTICEACCEDDVEDPVAVRGLYGRPGIAEVWRDCLESVLSRGWLTGPNPTLREELDAVFGETLR